MAHRRPHRHEEEEEHENHERWLVTYADMVTLLMVLFIVMFAMSQVDERKFMELKNGLAAGFAHSSSVLPGADTLLEESGTSPMQPVAPQLVQQATDATGTGAVGQSDTSQAAQDAQDAAESQLEAMQEVSGYRKIEADLRKALGAKGLAKDIKTTVDDRGLVISLVSRHVTFAADEATLTTRGEAVVDTLGPVLAALPEDVQVAGNTNQAPGRPEHYATDWDLSAARAVTVLRRLNEVIGIPAERLSVAAFGGTRPLEDPARPGSQAVNKRVDLVLVSPSDATTRALAQQYAQQGTGAGTSTGTSTGTTTDSGTGADTDTDTSAATTPGATTPTPEEQHR